MADVGLADGQLQGADALLAMWGPSFPGLADVEDAATAFLPLKPHLHASGPVSLVYISPGVVRLESADLSKRYLTAQRARRAAEAKKAMGARHLCHDPGCWCDGRALPRHCKAPGCWCEGDPVSGHYCTMKGCPESADARFRMDHGCPVLCEPGCPHHPRPGRVVSYWSGKSRCRMIRVFAELDYTPLVAPGRISGIGTLTLPGTWQVVAPTAKKWKALLDKFRKRWIRAWGEPPMLLWKDEFQERGAPHWHFYTSVSLTARAGELRKLGARYRAAVGDGMFFKEWLSAVWADVVDHPDPEERAKHERAGTNWKIDFDTTDPKRAAIYFSKYSVTGDKEYQNIPPAEWRESGEGSGRFWGVWGLEKATVAVRVTRDEQITMARAMRGYARHRTTAEQIIVPGSGNRYPVSHVAVSTRSVPRGVTADGVVRRRKVRRRTAPRLASCSGYLVTNDGPHLAETLARLVDRAGTDRGS